MFLLLLGGAGVAGMEGGDKWNSPSSWHGWEDNKWVDSNWRHDNKWHQGDWQGQSSSEDGSAGSSASWSLADPGQIKALRREKKSRRRSRSRPATMDEAMEAIFEATSSDDDDDAKAATKNPGTARGLGSGKGKGSGSPPTAVGDPGTARGLGGGEGDGSRTILHCTERDCDFASHEHNQFYMLDLDDWQERHRVRCMRCCKLHDPATFKDVDDDRFKRMCKALWRKKTSSEKAKLRSLKLKEELDKCARLKDETKRTARHRIISNVAVAMASFVASVLMLPETVITEVEDAFEAWSRECEHSIRDPSYVSKFVSAGCNILDNTMQFASVLCLMFCISEHVCSQ